MCTYAGRGCTVDWIPTVVLRLCSTPTVIHHSKYKNVNQFLFVAHGRQREITTGKIIPRGFCPRSRRIRGAKLLFSGRGVIKPRTVLRNARDWLCMRQRGKQRRKRSGGARSRLAAAAYPGELRRCPPRAGPSPEKGKPRERFGPPRPPSLPSSPFGGVSWNPTHAGTRRTLRLPTFTTCFF